MLEQAKQRTRTFQNTLRDHHIEIAVLTDESSIAYFAGFWGYLGVEFGRPTFLILTPDDDPVVITPLMENEMVKAMTWVENVLPWEDTGENRWEKVLKKVIGSNPKHIAVETPVLPGIVRMMLDSEYSGIELKDVSPLLGHQRTIKSQQEIEIMRQAGKIGAAMMSAAHQGLGEGVREYEVALAILEAGSHAAAGFLTDKGWEAYVSPVIHNLQIMQSGKDTSMVHRRASVKTLQHKDPVYFCFCNLLEFKHYRLGFDRMFFIGEVDEDAAFAEESAIAAQRAALDTIKAGVKASEVAEAANTIYRQRGFEPGYRTGRSIGMAYLESPELKEGDDTILQPGMTFAVDGGVTISNKAGGRIGDSIVVTEMGFEFLTEYSRELLVV